MELGFQDTRPTIYMMRGGYLYGDFIDLDKTIKFQVNNLFENVLSGTQEPIAQYDEQTEEEMNRVVDSIYESEYEEETWADFVVSASIWLGIAGAVVALWLVRRALIAKKNTKNA